MRRIINWLKGRAAPSFRSERSSKRRKTMRPGVERLEERELLAFDLNLTNLPNVSLRTTVNVTVNSSTQTLTIDGTTFADNVRIEYLPAGANSVFVVRQDGREVTRVPEFANFYNSWGTLILSARQIGRIGFYGSNGNDFVENATAFPSTLNGGSGDDIVIGGAAADVLYGELGNDSLYGGEGSDSLYGGDGNDSLYGSGGADFLWGMAGNDTLGGAAGNDQLYGETGNDSLYGDDNDDILSGGDNEDFLSGGNGQDVLLGDNGRDTLFGGNDADRLIGGEGNDRLDGEAGADRLEGGSGHDDLYGGLDNDSLYGGDGTDYLNVGPGNSQIADPGESAANVAYGGGVRVVTTSKAAGTEPLVLAQDNDLILRGYRETMLWSMYALPAAVNKAIGSISIAGERLYGAFVRQLAPAEFRLDTTFNSGPRLSLRLPNNVVEFRSTQPTFLGSWADPVFTAQFSLEVSVQFAANGPLRVESFDVDARVFLIDSHNTLADIALFVARFMSLLQPQTLEQTVDQQVRDQLRTIEPQLRSQLDKAAADVAGWLQKVSGRANDFTVSYDPASGQIVFRYPTFDA